jgi:hypothetical protein
MRVCLKTRTWRLGCDGPKLCKFCKHQIPETTHREHAPSPYRVNPYHNPHRSQLKPAPRGLKNGYPSNLLISRQNLSCRPVLLTKFERQMFSKKNQFQPRVISRAKYQNASVHVHYPNAPPPLASQSDSAISKRPLVGKPSCSAQVGSMLVECISFATRSG